MSLFVRQTPTKNGRVFLSIVDGRYSKVKKNTTQKTYKSYGYLDELEKIYTDPIQYLNDVCKKENEKRKARKKEPIPMGKPELINLGYFPYKRLYSELKVKQFLDAIQIYEGTKAEYVLSDIFEALIYSRVISPSSKIESYHKTIPSFFHDFNFKSSQMYKAISLLGKKQYDEVIFEGMRKEYEKNYLVKKDRVYFDCTNFYFEIDRPTDFLKPGPSKENRPNPLIGLGLLMDQEGVPIAYKLYPGNESEKPVFGQVLTEMKEQFKVKEKVIRVADKGLNCSANIVKTYVENDGYIFSESVRGANNEVKQWILDPEGYETITDKDGEVIYKYKTMVDYFNRVNINDRTDKKEYREIPQKRVVFWSRDYAIKTKLERDRVITKQEKVLRQESTYKTSKYGFGSKYIQEEIFDQNGELLDTTKERFIDFEKVKNDEQLDGFNMLVTSELDAPATEIIDTYKMLWKIEESFRLLKTTLVTRPIHHTKLEGIKGHFLICMTALFLTRIIEIKKLKNQVSASAAIRSLREYKAIKLGEDNYQLVYIDEVLEMFAKYFSVRLNDHFKNEKEILKLFKK